MDHNPIAIIGIGCRFPGGATDPDRLWDLLKRPHDLASKPPGARFNMDAFYVPGKTGSYGATSVQKGYWLEQDAYTFDAQFFNISPVEATYMDPQQRVLMETVYEALEDAGLPLEALKGSLTGVYCGALDQDYGYMAKQDPDRILPLMPTGYAFSILANRVSYFFDWKGPSMTVDTACAASLTAVHLAVNALRSGECSLAVAAGSNLMLSPDGFQSMSQMRILSEEGHCRMWDENADGFARGEGVAAVILKRLDDALRDGDEITCLIRGTGVGADGHNEGLTTPSTEAQLELIRATYARSGLNPLRPEDRCQYFEAHGTGTQVGDPKEALAVRRAFFDRTSTAEDILHVGSVKSVIGHLEASAGLSGLIKASLAVKHGVIPPNLHFAKVHPAIASHMDHLRVPTEALAWPKLPPGVPRRASINSFGFGGGNAHVIVESFDRAGLNKDVAGSIAVPILPFVFSAASEERLEAMLQRYLRFLATRPAVDLIDLAVSLMTRRSAFQHRLILNAGSIEALGEVIQNELARWPSRAHSNGIGRSVTSGPRYILGIFTGQGAQWPQMSLDVILASPQATSWLGELQDSLDTLPGKYRPRFVLLEELAASPDHSRVNSAEVSLPLRTAIQILQIRILRTLGVRFAAVVGHSSGEISAAYAAGRLSAADAIRTAHLRGLSAQKAECDGAMLAVGISWQQAQEICNAEPYVGKVVASASNSLSNVTLSGDSNCIQQLAWLLRSMDFDPKILHVDKPYHSHYMNPCAEYYAKAMEECQIQVSRDSSETQWFSTVYEGREMQDYEPAYWKENMLRPVLFSQAITAALESMPTIDAVLEVGPHPALQGPTMQTMSSFGAARNMAEIPYISLAQRNKDGIQTLQGAIGSLYSSLGAEKLDIPSYVRLFHPHRDKIALVRNLPLYPFDHSRSYGGLSRVARARLYRQDAIHPLLGSMSCETGEHEWRWRNHLRSQDIDWLEDHKMESQVVFPISGILSMIHAAANFIAGANSLQSVTVEELVLEHAIVVPDDAEGIETMLTIQIEPGNGKRRDEGTVSGHLRYYAAFGDDLRCCCSGRVRLALGEIDVNLLGSQGPKLPGLRSVDTNRFYREISRLGYGYNGGFKGLTNLLRRKDAASASIGSHTYQKSVWPDPVSLDVSLQSILVAMGAPGDGQIIDLHLPVGIDRITINSAFGNNATPSDQGDSLVSVESGLTSTGVFGITGDIDIFNSDGKRVVQIEGLSIVPLKSAELDRLNLFAETVWAPHQVVVSTKTTKSLAEYEKSARDIDHIALLYLQKIQHQISPEDRAGLDFHRGRYVAWMDHVLSQTRQGLHSKMRPEDLDTNLESLGVKEDDKPTNIERQLLDVIRENAVTWLRGETTLMQRMFDGDQLARYYGESAALRVMNASLADTVAQITFRLPRMKILEVGAGTGSATRETLRHIDGRYDSYTYTDVSPSFFDAAAREFVEEGGARLQMKVLDVEQDPVSQGFVEHGYDLIIAANVLHATRSLNQTLGNVRKLLKPGGYLIILELTCVDVIAPAATVGVFEGWWAGMEDGRQWGPTISAPQWEQLLRNTGYELEASSGEAEQNAMRMSVMVAQATDERVLCIKSPLTMNPSAQYDDLVMIGGTMGKMTTMIEPLLGLVGPFFRRATHVKSLEDFAPPKNANRATILFLSDTDTLMLGHGITKEHLSSLKQVVSCMDKLLWIGIEDPDGMNLPYLQMNRAFLASLRYEYPQSTIQHLIIDSKQTIVPEMIANSLMRLVHTKLSNDYKLSQMVTSIEPELRLEGGMLQIPRIRHSNSMNQRLRGSRGLGKAHVDLQSSCVQAIETAGGLSLVASPRPRQCESSCGAENEVRICVRYATLPAIRIAPAIFLHLVLGLEEATGQRIVALSQANASEVSVEGSRTLDVPSWLSEENEAAYVKQVSAMLIIAGLILQTPSGSTVIIHGPDSYEENSFCSALSDFAAKHGVEVWHVGTSASDKPNYWQISSWSSTQTLLRQVPKNACMLVTLPGKTGGVIEKLQSVMRDLGAAVFDVTDVYRTQATDVPKSRAGSIQNVLNMLSTLSGELLIKESSLSTISADQISQHPLPVQSLEIVNWTHGDLTLSAHAMPASSLVELSNQKTYVLFGMTGEIGQSICRWLIDRGAHFVVLGSRSPNIDAQWINEMAQLGVRVLVMSIDITDRASILQIDEELRKQGFPIVGGVMNGAMVLNDGAFADTTADGWRAVLAPKVVGSSLLDQVYRDANLDFFVLMGSISGCIGNMNQSAYAAANGFMSGLVSQRRRRHQTGSIVHPAQIRGIGYLERTDARLLDFLADTMSSFALSEPDLHELIAEAILAGHPASGRQPEILGGIRTADPSKYPNVLWYNFPPMWNFIGHSQQTQTADTNGNQKLTIRDQLQSAANLNAVAAIVGNGFQQKLRGKLQLPADAMVTGSSRLVDMGVDSLVAVDLRLWFSKELNADISIIQLLGNISIDDLATTASQQLDPGLIPACTIDR